MQVKVLLALIIIILITIAIICGCGGGNGTTQPASLVTPTQNMTDNMAYITIKVKWPEQGMAGKMIMSSEDGKEITASMPPDAKKIELKIFNYKGKDESLPIDFTKTDDILAEGRLPEPETQITIPIPVPTQVPTNPNILPAIPVKVWAGCFTDPNSTDPNSALSTAEHYMVLKVGDQTANLKLGNYDLTLTADPNSIVLGGSTVSGSNLISNIVAVPTPTPGRTVVENNLTPMNPCVAVITPEGSPLPTDTPTPTPTPIRVSSNITATLMITYPTPTDNTGSTSVPTPKFIANKQITFTLIKGNDEYTTLSSESSEESSDETIESDTVTGTTNSKGTCTIKLLSGTTGDKVIKASFMADLNDPNSVYSDQCIITMITPTPTPIRTPSTVPMNVAGNWKDSGNEAGYTITQSGTYQEDLTFTCIYPGSPTSTPAPTTTPPSINPTPTLKPLPSEGSWNGYIEDNRISMWPPYHEPMIGTVKKISGEQYIFWIGGYSNRHYSEWVMK